MKTKLWNLKYKKLIFLLSTQFAQIVIFGVEITQKIKLVWFIVKYYYTVETNYCC